MNKKNISNDIIYNTSIVTCVRANSLPIDIDNIENIIYVLIIEKVESRSKNVYISHKCKFN